MLARALWVLGGLAPWGCGKGGAAAGTERGPCYGNGTCNPGLSCLSDVCVATGAAPAKSAASTPSMATPNGKAEAVLMLTKIGKNAKRAYVEQGQFPRGAVGLTPATACCQGPDHHCVSPTSAWADNPLWKALDFQIDEPALFQYAFQGDGGSFTAKAIGDLDCDGVPITYELVGSVVDGSPTVTLTEPPTNSY
jgi:hypothetical protein